MNERPLTHRELEILASSINRTEVTLDSLPVLREEVAELRERKGMEQAVIESIRRVRKGAERIGAHEDVVNLFWEEYLVGKHYFMQARNNKALSGSVRVIYETDGMTLMRDSAEKAASYIDEHAIEKLSTRSHRFLGEVEMLSGHPYEAVEHFQTAIRLFEEMEDPWQRVNALELKGFLAEAYIRSLQEYFGIGLAKVTFGEYDKGIGARLKKRDYYTWAVWKSGCVTKAWDAILDRRIELKDRERENFLDMLDEADKITVFPNGENTWGDKDFGYRKEEIASIRRRISQIYSS